MAFQERMVGKNQILEVVEAAAEVAVGTYGLKVWGLDIVGGSGRPVVRIFVDTPWEGKSIPFVMPETRSQKSKKRAVHPKKMNAKADILPFDDVDNEESLSKESINNELLEETAISENSAADNSMADNSMEDGSMNDGFLNGEFSNFESVTIGQCAHISRMIGLALEVEDTFADEWVLEVSSPGLERGFYQLSQLASYIGHPVEISLEETHPDYENRRKFRGSLESVEDSSFTLKLEAPLNELCSIAWDTVKKATLIHMFPDTTLSKAQVS